MLAFCMHSMPVKADTYGGWEFLEISHDFNKKVWSAFYFEHDNLEYQTFDAFYTRLTVGYKFTKWLKNDVAWDWLKERGTHCHRFIYDLTESRRALIKIANTVNLPALFLKPSINGFKSLSTAEILTLFTLILIKYSFTVL